MSVPVPRKYGSLSPNLLSMSYGFLWKSVPEKYRCLSPENNPPSPATEKGPGDEVFTRTVREPLVPAPLLQRKILAIFIAIFK